MDKIVGIANCEEKAWISEACENLAIRIDVGMSKGCGDGFPEVLEICENSSVHLVELQGTGELYAMKAMEKSMMLNCNKIDDLIVKKLVLKYPILPNEAKPSISGITIPLLVPGLKDFILCGPWPWIKSSQ
ncbi:hypothetical protein SO802_018733 [Lithocarpus litseifolius]|uniref:Uncharacterized protein n=1 Tax=Lithocarpus litseifolius TaxID=425828 RepID=A0AAW2CQ12_9ROSI